MSTERMLRAGQLASFTIAPSSCTAPGGRNTTGMTTLADVDKQLVDNVRLRGWKDSIDKDAVEIFDLLRSEAVAKMGADPERHEVRFTDVGDGLPSQPSRRIGEHTVCTGADEARVYASMLQLRIPKHNIEVVALLQLTSSASGAKEGLHNTPVMQWNMKASLIEGSINESLGAGSANVLKLGTAAQHLAELICKTTLERAAALSKPNPE